LSDDRPKNYPQSFESEQALLGCIIKDPDVMTAILPIISDHTQMYTPRHQKIFLAAKALHYAKEPIDFTTVAAELDKRKALYEAGNVSYLVELYDATGTTVNATTYAKKIIEKYQYRRLIQTSGEIAQAALDQQYTPQELASMLSQQLITLTSERTSREFKLISDYTGELIQHLDHISTGKKTLGIPSGLSDLDELTGGFQKSEFYCIAGRPSMGKTALLNCIASNMAQLGHKVAVFSAESNAQEYTLRTMCTEARLDSMKLKRGRIEDWDLINTVVSRMSQWQYWIDDTPSIDINSLVTKATHMVQDKGIECIFVDYIQKLTTAQRTSNRREQVTEFARALKQLSSVLNVPVVCACQLSRAVEQRHNKRPLLSDLGESGDIEREADVVMGLFRPELYIKKKKKDEGKFENYAELTIMKARNGPVGLVDLFFNKVFTRFENYQNEILPF